MSWEANWRKAVTENISGISNKWDPIERLTRNILNTNTVEHLHRYALARKLTGKKSVLDLACGEGYGSNLLAETCSQVLGIDIDAGVIERARGTYKAANLVFQQGSATALPINDDSFDVVVSFETIEHIDDHEALLKEIKRVLKPAGLLLISSPDKLNYSEIPGHSNPYHLRELYAGEFRNLVSKYFQQVHYIGQRAVSGSFMFNGNGCASMEVYYGSFTGIDSDNGFQPMYNIALASDGPLPSVPCSLFDSREVLEEAVTRMEKSVKSTWKYKVGNFILAPLSWLRHR